MTGADPGFWKGKGVWITVISTRTKDRIKLNYSHLFCISNDKSLMAVMQYILLMGSAGNHARDLLPGLCERSKSGDPRGSPKSGDPGVHLKNRRGGGPGGPP